MPAFPATHAKIIQLAKSDDATADDLAEQIQMDPGLLANIFKLANEREVLGLTHSEIGGLLASEWQFRTCVRDSEAFWTERVPFRS